MGRFRPFATYTQTDSPQERQSNENTTKPNSFLARETIGGYTFDTNIHTPLLPASPAGQIGRNRSGKDDSKI